MRFSFTLGQPALYVAVPLRQAGAVAGVVRLSVPVSAVDEALQTIRVHLLGAAAVIILLGAAASYLISRRIVRPIEDLREGADRFAGGDFDARLPVPRVVEIAALATSMNEMARQLSGRIATIQEQRNTLESILEGMAEGVVAVDVGKRVLLLNRAAGGMLGVDPAGAQGRSIQELSRNMPFQAFVVRSLGAAEPVEEEIAAGENGALLIRASGVPLHDGAGGRIGALIVLNDITQLHRLERVRRDFVANVSHELKTPVTSIAGFVETLLDGALDDRATAERFLEIIRRQAERLNAIVTDLLSLARLEQETGSERIAFEESGLCGLLSEAIEATRDRAAKKGIILELECPEDRSFPAQALLLSQAVVNLIDNAVTYSEPGSRVVVRGAVSGRGDLDPGRRPGHRHPAGASPAAVRAVLPRGQEPQPATGRHGSRPGHRQARRAGPRRDGRRGERAREGQHLHDHDPPGASNTNLTIPSSGALQPRSIFSACKE